MLLDMLDVAAPFLVPDDSLPHAIVLAIRMYSLSQDIAVTQ
jgi:hypothetical protein